MKLVRTLLVTAFIVLVIVGYAAAEDDCGCGDSWDSPSDDWDDGGSGSFNDDDDDSGSSGDDSSSDDSGSSGDDSGSGDSGSSGDDSGSGSDGNGASGGQESDSGNSGSGSYSSDSGTSSGSNGGSAEDGILWRIKGDDLFTKGQYNESVAAYEKAISYDPFSLKAWRGKGIALLSLNRTADAGNAFRQALKLDPGDASTYALLGDARFAAGEFADAAEQYLKALAMNPNSAGVSEKLAAAYAAEKSGLTVEAGTSGNVSGTTVPTEIQTVPIANETATMTTEPTGKELPITTKAGIPGGVTGILALLGALLLIGFRRK